MSETETSSLVVNSLIVVSEIAVIFAFVIIIMLVVGFRKRKKKKLLAVAFLEDVKINEAQREQALKKTFDESTTLEDEEKNKLVKVLISAEKKTYIHVAQLFMGYKPESIMELGEEIKNISEHHVGVIEQISQNPIAASGDDSEEDEAAMRELKKQVTQLRDEKKLLKEKNFQLQSDFDASMETMERMTTEFANMYEGGAKDGEKKVKNEMYQLKQTLAQKKEYTEADDDSSDSVPELTAEKDTGDVDADDIDALLDSTGDGAESK